MSTWAPLTVLTCTPAADPQAPAVAPCATGQEVGTALVYMPTSDPSVPTADHFEMAGFAFALVILVFLLSAGLGMVIRMFAR